MPAAFEGWACVELLGHRVRYGRVSEVTMFGEAMLRIEIPTDPPTEEFYSGKALYGIRPVNEEAVRAYHRPRQALAAAPLEIDRARFLDDDDDDDDDDDYDAAAVCGGCGNPIREGEAVEDVADDNDESRLWHERCAVEHANSVDDAPLPDAIDSDAPAQGFSAALGLKVCVHDGVTPNDSVVANRHVDEPPGGG